MDSDGFGDQNDEGISSCLPPSEQYVLDNSDCDDMVYDIDVADSCQTTLVQMEDMCVLLTLY